MLASTAGLSPIAAYAHIESRLMLSSSPSSEPCSEASPPIPCSEAAPLIPVLLASPRHTSLLWSPVMLELAVSLSAFAPATSSGKPHSASGILPPPSVGGGSVLAGSLLASPPRRGGGRSDAQPCNPTAPVGSRLCSPHPAP